MAVQPLSSRTAMVDTSRGCPGYERNLQENWNGNVQFGGTPIVPASLEELCQVVVSAPPPIRVVGRGHSFTPLAECTGGTLLSLAKLNKIVDFVPPTSSANGSLTIQGGATYTDVISFLATRGALRNLPSCPQFTVAGAIATATHGSGVNIPNLAANVIMMEFVQGDGTLVQYSRNDKDDLLKRVRVHLGCLGVVSSLTLEIVPYFEVEAFRYDDIPLELMIEKLPELWKSCDSLSVWSSGMGQGHGKGTCWMTFRHFRIVPTSEAERVSLIKSHEALLESTETLCDRPISRYCADPRDPVLFTPTGRGPWYDMLTATMQDGQETSMTTVDLQAEFFVPLENAQQSLRAVWKATREWNFSSPWGYQGESTMGDVDAMEFRQVKGGDGSWLSPHSVDSLGIHISFNRNADCKMVLEEMVPAIERALEPFSPRAHWGKLGKETYDLEYIEEMYGNDLEAFRKLCLKHDATGKFRNSHVSRILFREA